MLNQTEHPAYFVNQEDTTMAKSPREYDRHERYRNAARYRKPGTQRAAFLAEQATRLSSTSAVIANKLKTYTADQIRAAANIGALA